MKSTMGETRTKSQIFASESIRFDRSRHPPPQLPEWPKDLNANQVQYQTSVFIQVEIKIVMKPFRSRRWLSWLEPGPSAYKC